jgi:3-methyladenine DNA glycosylase/8-oxoguanine DNA glycosylase
VQRIDLAGHDHDWLLRFLRPRAVPGVETFVDHAYVRALRIGHELHVLTLTAADGGLLAGCEPALPGPTLLRIVRTITGADTDLPAFRAHVADDAILGPLVAARPGVRLVRIPDPFEGVVRAILGQQISLAAASTIAGRLARRLGDAVPTGRGPELHVFPSAQALARADVQELRALGLPPGRARTLQAAARAISGGTLNLSRLGSLPGAAAGAALLALPGIGPWTAAYIRMRVLGDADAFPASDLGVLKALRRILLDDRINRRQAEQVAERWRPWRGLGAIHLWESLSDDVRGPAPSAQRLRPPTGLTR